MAQLEQGYWYGTGFAFPFETIEDVIIENGTTLTVFNDNNFPGRRDVMQSWPMITRLFRFVYQKLFSKLYK